MFLRSIGDVLVGEETVGVLFVQMRFLSLSFRTIG